MEPLRDPSIDSMSWEGWTFPWKGVAPRDGEPGMLRLRENTGGLRPYEYIRETRAVYRAATGWEDWRAFEQFGFNIVAWRPLTEREREGWVLARRRGPAASPPAPTHY